MSCSHCTNKAVLALFSMLLFAPLPVKHGFSGTSFAYKSIESSGVLWLGSLMYSPIRDQPGRQKSLQVFPVEDLMQDIDYTGNGKKTNRVLRQV